MPTVITKTPAEQKLEGYISLLISKWVIPMDPKRFAGWDIPRQAICDATFIGNSGRMLINMPAMDFLKVLYPQEFIAAVLIATYKDRDTFTEHNINFAHQMIFEQPLADDLIHSVATRVELAILKAQAAYVNAQNKVPAEVQVVTHPA